MSIRILLVDDHAMMLDGLEAILKQPGNLTLVAKTVNAHYALSYIRKDLIDLLITDYSMPDMNGLELLREAKKAHPGLKIIVLSMHDEPLTVREIINSGADGYILKKYAHQELLQAINIVTQGGQYWSPEINRILIRGIQKDEHNTELTERELEVLKLLVQELTSKEIATKLFLSERTIETHRKNLMRKTNSSNIVGLIKYAFANKVID